MHELNFIPLSYRKNVSLPSVQIEEYTGQLYGGYYIPGTIVAVYNETLESTLAHEYRHHLQVYYGYTLVVNSVEHDCEYDTFIRNYFRSSWSEMDALLFERKVAPNWLNDWWLNKLVLE